MSEDREIWSQFLRTRTGQRLLPKLLESLPALLEKGDINEILIRSGEVRGWKIAVVGLLALAVPEPKAVEQAANNYPPLADDDAWEDGHKLKQTPK